MIPSTVSIYYRDRVSGTPAEKGDGSISTDDFYRLFLIPGMNHCFGSADCDTPWYVAGAAQTMPAGLTGAMHSVPGFENANRDVVLA